MNSAVTSVPCLAATAPSRRHMAWTSCLVANPAVSLLALWFAAVSAASRALLAAEQEANMVMSRMMMTPVDSRAGVGFREVWLSLAGGLDGVVMMSPCVGARGKVALRRQRGWSVSVHWLQRDSMSGFRVPAPRSANVSRGGGQTIRASMYGRAFVVVTSREPALCGLVGT